MHLVGFISCYIGLLLCLVLPNVVEAHSSGRLGLTITDTHVEAPFDKVPRLCNSPILPADTIIRSVTSGNWSDPAVWSNGQVPGAGSRVHVAAGTTVTYDVNATAVVQCIEIQDNGHLQFSTTAHTALWLDDGLWVMPLGALTIGTDANPVLADVRAEIVFADTPLKTGVVGAMGPDPQQYGKGLLAFGDVTMRGAQKDPTFVRLAGDVNAGDTVITVTESLTGWRSGDQVIVPDTRHLTSGDLVGGLPRRKESQSEELTIQAVNGTQITLSAPLQFNHHCARDGDNVTIATRQDGQQLCAHVGNLTRNVVLKSENPEGVAGHSMYFHRANIDIQYIQYQNMGRTTSELLNNSTFDGNSELSHVGTNQIGRYALHMHHVYGQTPAHSSGYQYQLVGVVIDKNPKWGLTIHDTHFGLVKDVIAYKSLGGAIVTEDGSESYNVFDHNFVVGSEGVGAHTSRYDPEGRRGAAFWFHAMHNYVRNNVVADSGEGYPFYIQNATGNSQEADKIMNIPLSPGGNTTQVGQFRQSSRANLPMLEFDNNEAYSMSFFGLANWSANGEVQYVDTSIWHTKTAVHFDYPSNVTQILDNLVIRGNNGQGNGITSHNPGNIVLRNGDIQGLGDVFNEDEREPKSVLFEDSYFRNKGGIRIENAQQGVHDNTYTFRNLRFEAMPEYPLTTFSGTFSDAYKRGGWYLAYALHKETALVYDYQGIPGNNFQFFFHEQHPDVLLPMVCAPNQFGPTGAVKSVPACTCPVDGLTNGQCWEAHGQAMLLELPTCEDSTSHPEVNGIFCPFTGNEPPPSLPAPPRITVSHPTVNSSFEASDITIRYAITGDLVGTNTDHLHLQLDDNPEVRGIALTEGMYTFENVLAGAHVIRGYLAKADHTKIEGTEISVSFTTTEPELPNVAPTITFGQNISNLIATIGQAFVLRVTATDVDGDTVELTADPLPVGAQFD